MTEAAHQMASNPLPPRSRFAGCVGIAAGPDVAIMDEDGNLLPPGALGEVVIRGRNVTAGYEANPDANAKAFTNGWFRTGDQGVMDEARLSAPDRPAEGADQPRRREDQPAGGRHDHHGPSGGGPGRHLRRAARQAGRGRRRRRGAARRRACDERELRDFVGTRVADFKVPRKIVFLPKFPRAPPASCSASAWPRNSALRRMKIAIFGAGAIGGYLAVKLHQAGADVTFIARGPHLAAMRQTALTLQSEGETTTVRPPCHRRGREAGPQDYVIVTLKAHRPAGGGARRSPS